MQSLQGLYLILSLFPSETATASGSVIPGLCITKPPAVSHETLVILIGTVFEFQHIRQISQTRKHQNLVDSDCS